MCLFVAIVKLEKLAKEHNFSLSSSTFHKIEVPEMIQNQENFYSPRIAIDLHSFIPYSNPFYKKTLE